MLKTTSHTSLAITISKPLLIFSESQSGLRTERVPKFQFDDDFFFSEREIEQDKLIICALVVMKMRPETFPLCFLQARVNMGYMLV